ncbi:MAG: zinc-ribbon domain-containing protein [Clostridium sp.]|nr:zinc-ribbon domain-containing protein [Clostridium sp.]
MCEERKKCLNCGQENDKDSKFCVKCGKKLINEDCEEEKIEKEENIFLNILKALLIIIIIAVALAFLVVFINNLQENKTVLNKGDKKVEQVDTETALAEKEENQDETKQEEVNEEEPKFEEKEILNQVEDKTMLEGLIYDLYNLSRLNENVFPTTDQEKLDLLQLLAYDELIPNKSDGSGHYYFLSKEEADNILLSAIGSSINENNLYKSSISSYYESGNYYFSVRKRGKANQGPYTDIESIKQIDEYNVIIKGNTGIKDDYLGKILSCGDFEAKAKLNSSSIFSGFTIENIEFTNESFCEEKFNENTQYKTYVNKELGFSVDYPASWNLEDRNDEGIYKIIASTTDGDIRFNLLSIEKVGVLGYHGHEKSHFHGLIKYDHVSDNYFVLTEQDGGNIGYIYAIGDEEKAVGFSIIYPLDRKKELDPVIEKIYKSFKINI